MEAVPGKTRHSESDACKQMDKLCSSAPFSSTPSPNSVQAKTRPGAGSGLLDEVM